MEHLGTILEREGDALELLLFKLVETNLLIAAGEARFVPRATSEVERCRLRAAELDLVRAATVDREQPGATLRELASSAPGPWPAILRDHHDVLSRLVAEIEVVGHQNARAAERAIVELGRDAAHADERVAVGVGAAAPPPPVRPVRNAELDRLARGAAMRSVLGTAARLRMPDLLEFLR